MHCHIYTVANLKVIQVPPLQGFQGELVSEKSSVYPWEKVRTGRAWAVHLSQTGNLREKVALALPLHTTLKVHGFSVCMSTRGKHLVGHHVSAWPMRGLLWPHMCWIHGST